MSLVAADALGAFSTGQGRGATGVGVDNAESVQNYIINIDPKETPLFTFIKKKRAYAVYHEWLQDSYASKSATGAGEGALLGSDTLTTKTRVANYCMIWRRVYEVTGTQQAVIQHGGIKKELAYQARKKMVEIKRDINYSLYQSVSATLETADATGSRNLDGFGELMSGDKTAHTGDASYYPSAFTGDSAEETFNLVLLDIYDDGAIPNACFAPPAIKRRMSRWVAGSTKFTDVEDKKLTLAVEVYESDLGYIRLFIDRDAGEPGLNLVNSWGLIVGDFSNTAVSFLRPLHTRMLPTVKDSVAGMVQAEGTLEYGNLNQFGWMKISA